MLALPLTSSPFTALFGLSSCVRDYSRTPVVLLQAAMQSPFATTMIDSLQDPPRKKPWGYTFPNASDDALSLLEGLMRFDPNSR